MNKARFEEDYKLALKIQNFAKKENDWAEVSRISRTKSYFNMNKREQQAANISFELAYKDQGMLRESVKGSPKGGEKKVYINGKWFTRDEYFDNMDELSIDRLKELDGNSEVIIRLARQGLADSWDEILTGD